MLLAFAALVYAQPAAPECPPAQECTAAAIGFVAGTSLDEVRAALAAHPEGVALTLTAGARPWTAEELEALVYRSKEATNLRALVLSGNPVGDASAMAIAASPHLGRLTTLDLRGCKVREAGARGLAYSEGLGALTVLTLDGRGIGVRGREALKARFGAVVILAE